MRRAYETANIYQGGQARSNAARGFPTGVPIPPPNSIEWGPYSTRDLGSIDDPETGAGDILDLIEGDRDYTLPNELLDLIIDMPVGHRTSNEFQAQYLTGVPIGYLVGKLMLRMRERGMNGLRGIESLVLVGKFYRVHSEVVIGPLIKNPYDNAAVPGERHPEYYYDKTIRRDLQEYNFMQYPLGKVLYYPYGVVNADNEALFNIAEETNFFSNDVDATLLEYIDRWTGEQGGSDVQFFFFGEGAYLAKRYGTLNVFPDRIRHAHIMRTAGLRQIILKKYELFIIFADTFFSKVMKQYRLFIPGSESNCFLQSIQWCLLKSAEAKFFNELSSETICGAQDEEVVTSQYNEETEKRRVEMLTQYILSRVTSMNPKDYLRKYAQGFPTSEMRNLALLFLKTIKVRITLWKRNGKGEWEDILKFDGIEKVEYHETIVLFLMDDRGKIVDIKSQNQSATDAFNSKGITDGTLGHMLHCIGVYPPPNFFIPLPTPSPINAPNIGRARSTFCEQISFLATPLLEDLYKKNKYYPGISFPELSEFVEFQNARYRRREVSTLIFESTSSSSSSSSSSNSSNNDRKRKRYNEIQAEREGAPRVFVYAYDLETVDNTGEVQHMVYPPFRKEVPYEYRSLYEPIECQIPFSAQWIGVNLDDNGKFLERKVSESIIPLDYSSSSTYSGREDSFDVGKEYFTTDPHTNYGPNLLLGECIESFLVDIAVDTHAKGGKVAYLYATNGSKFDAYVTLQFQRFEITDMLKTSRGILFAKLRVPIVLPPPDKAYSYKDDPVDMIKISIILRDVSLIVPGSLARLCKGFEVPKKYCKIDFPIQMVNASNCFHPKVMSICREYGEMDVCALAVILKKINLLIGNSVWNPANHTSDKPPIVQFLTCMSMIRSSTKVHFDKVLPAFLHPRAVDIPVLRNWIAMAAIGGRVTAYARTYVSYYLEGILRAHQKKDVPQLQKLHKEMLAKGACMQCLDFTSLYPYVMDSCPLPMGHLGDISPEECERHISVMHCGLCDAMRSLCPQHRYYFNKNDTSLRPFSIILVKNVRPTQTINRFQNLCPRKTYNASTGKPIGLNYSLESNEEFFERTGGKEKMLDTQAFSNVDLYWMRRQGFIFDIIGGITWTTTMAYNTFIGPAFQMRIDAKKQGNKLLSDFMKLNYNGAYGITIQQDITDTFFLANLPEEYRHVSPLEPTMRDEILKTMVSGRRDNDLLASEELTGEAFYFPSGQSFIQKKKREHLAEFYAKQSPMQVGAAILAYARHVGNLVLFNLPSTFDYIYTDTDSIAISDFTLQNDIALQKLIMNRDDAPMGSLKNDHAENNGTEPRIILGLIGAKKVKGYITLNAEGELRIFNTFKGLNVSLDIGGKKISPEYSEYVTTKSLLSINRNYTSEDVEVQAWKRDLGSGVSIGNHMQKFEKETYTNFFQGVYPRNARGCGYFESVIPYGSVALNSIEPFEKKDMVNFDKDKPSRRIYEAYSDLLEDFIEDYYAGCKDEYNPGTEEYQKILDLFAGIAQEQQQQ